MSYDLDIREEELKNKIAQDYFWLYDNTKIIGNVDFCIAMHQSKSEIFEQESLLWAEAKKGISDIYKSLVQLILTIGKARTFDKYLPPAMLGAFDAEKMAFIPYNDIHDIFYINDFNWNVTPSNHETKEFKLVFEKVQAIIDTNALLFRYDADDKELKSFIKTNFVVGKFGFSKIRIDKNNFMVIYNKWLQAVKPTVVVNWEMAKKSNIIDGDFYLADLLSGENVTLKENLFVLLKSTYYEVDRKMNEIGMFNSSSVFFSDKQKAHIQFWNKYERPPKEEYWDYIVKRRDLLVPQDVRERKGSFFTPQIWVELSQKYLTDVLGDNWQDEYYIWDCAAGTGNLLAGLTNKYNIWASTLDRQDVDVMKDRIKNGANLLEDHVFQFDFLNDDFSKLPKSLQAIVNDSEKRKKLVIYINPPYAEAGNSQVRKTKTAKAGVSIDNNTYTKYQDKLGKAGNELFSQFLIRIYFELNNCLIAEFSKMKLINGTNSKLFRTNFLSKLEKCFVVPANTFDNVKGTFPIGFKIWNTGKKESLDTFYSDVYNKDAISIGTKKFYTNDNLSLKINQWLRKYQDEKNESIATLVGDAPDFQHYNTVFIQMNKGVGHLIYFPLTRTNLIYGAVYLAVRHCITATWLNDRDQFLFPNKKWEKDKEFQNDCLAFTLFHGQNRISSKDSVNHWIPFTEYEVNSREKFDSNFMSKFINGKLKIEDNGDLMTKKSVKMSEKLEFSSAAQSVFQAGRNLYTYYHQQANCNVNASLYDIREHFQGRKDGVGKMNSKSEDETYTNLIKTLREKVELLALKIQPKVYEYGFLLE